MTPRGAPEFAVTTAAEGGTTVVAVRGELDIGSAPVLRDALLRLLADGEAPELAIDASGVTFVDSSGLAVLLMASRRWNDAGTPLVLRCPSRALMRIVELTGAKAAFVIEGA
jgi:anti-anti-sigma factor